MVGSVADSGGRGDEAREMIAPPGPRTAFASIAVGAVAVAVIAGCSTSPKAPAAPAAGGVKPTVVLVHGAWADNSSWDGEVSELEKEGYDARAISNPLKDLTTDAESVKSFLATI